MHPKLKECIVLHPKHIFFDSLHHIHIYIYIVNHIHFPIFGHILNRQPPQANHMLIYKVILDKISCEMDEMN